MPPPEKLFIYEIEGRVYPPDDLTGEDFLGCWREGDYSYLFFGPPQGSSGQGLGGHPGGRPLLLRERHELRRLGGGPAPAENLHGGVSPLPGVGGPGPGGRARLVIRMEPGLAFGSGYHPTTRTCLELLRRVYEADAPRKVLDLGTGTGILALAALALGAERVVAVEYNELAVRTAARNLKHNQRRAEVHLIQADARHFAHLPAGLVLANIHLDVLLDLLDLPEFLDKDWYIFSGILGDPVGDVSGAPEGDPSPWKWRPWMKICGLRCWPGANNHTPPGLFIVKDLTYPLTERPHRSKEYYP